MNLQLKKPKRNKRVALGEASDPDLKKRTKTVTSLEPEKVREEQELPVIKIDSDPEPDWESKEWYEHVDELPDDPNEDSYRELSVADFGAALRRGICLEDSPGENTKDRKADTKLVSHDYTGIGYKPK